VKEHQQQSSLGRAIFAGWSSVGVFVLTAWLILVAGCTENPFNDDSEKISSRAISGAVTLNDGAVPKGVYVWLEGLDVGTRTDEQGEFSLVLPPPSSSSAGSAMDGVFNLYFYVANYAIDTAEVVLVNGEVARSEGDINDQSELKQSKQLYKLLDVVTSVSPQTILFEYWGKMNISVTLNAISSSVVVESLKKIANRVVFRTGLVLVDENDQFVKVIGQGSSWDLGLETIRQEQTTWRIRKSWPPCELPVGVYRFIPYLIIRQPNVPQALIESLGRDAQNLDRSYLNMPFIPRGGKLIVSETATG
jgi:hypothetical protein|tara:strand:- start:1556 stop:2470 length:915 start_codon:yes stop_codon:yes gene_type:complete